MGPSDSEGMFRYQLRLVDEHIPAVMRRSSVFLWSSIFAFLIAFWALYQFKRRVRTIESK
jgi:hypothetical protein